MKTCFINTSDKKGGAAIACYRLFKAIQKKNSDTSMIVCEKQTSDDTVELIHKNNLSKKIYTFKMLAEYAVFNKLFKNKNIATTYSTSFFGNDISKLETVKNSDIINLHWINLSFLNLSNIEKILELNKPVVWHLHDMWAFTGGCHYSNSCESYLSECKNCQFLNNKGENDLSNKYFKLKEKIYNASNLTIVTPSNWLANEARKSILFKNKKIEVIGNTLDTDFFKPKEQKSIKQKFGLDASKKHILFGAMNVLDERKGFSFFKTAISELAQNSNFTDSVELVILGKFDPEIFAGINPKLKIHSLGFVSDQNTIADIYALANVFVIPTLEDNLPNTILESLSCGTPVVSFDTGGIPDMVKHNYNGYVAKYRNNEDLKTGINSILMGDASIDFRSNARNYVLENYSEAIITEKYISLYTQLLNKK